MKKYLALLLCFTLIFVIACSSTKTSSTTTATTAPSPATTEKGNGMTTVQFYLDYPPLADYLGKINPVLQANYNTKFEVVSYNEPTAYQTALRVGFSTKESADIFKWWDGFRMKELIDAGFIADMSKEWDEMIADGVKPSLKEAFTFNGKQYGVPGGLHYWPIYYNKKIFSDNNLKPPTTWAEFLALCEALKAKGITPLSQSLSLSWEGFIWFEDLMIRSYPEVYKKLVVGKAKYTDPEVVEVMQLWKSLYDKGYFYKPLDLLKEVPGEFKKGTVAMTLIGTWFSDYFNGVGLKPGEDYDSFILPDVKPEAGNVMISEITPFLVSKNSKNVDNAKKALMLMTKKDVLENFLPLYGGIPIRNDVESKDPVIKKLAAGVQDNNSKLITRFWEATPSELSEYASSEFTRFMLNPKIYMEVLKNIQNKADKYWAEHK